MLLRPALRLRLHPEPGQEVDHRLARLVDDADEFGADLQQEHQHADDDESHPVAVARLRERRLQHGAGAEKCGDAVDDQHRLAVAEAKLLQAVVQMALVGLHQRLLVHPAAHDREEGVGQRHPDDEQRRHERQHRNLLEPEHGQHRQAETEEQRARVAHENLGRMKIEHQESQNAAQQHDREQNDGAVAHNDAHAHDAGDGDGGHAGGKPVQPVDQVDRVGHADDPENRQRNADPLRQRLHGRPERDVDEVHFNIEAEHDDAGHADLNQEFELGVQVEPVVQRAHQHNQRASGEQSADQVPVAGQHVIVRNEGEKQQNHDSERDINRETAETRHDAAVYLPCVRHVDGADAEGKLLDPRRQQKRKRKRREKTGNANPEQNASRHES